MATVCPICGEKTGKILKKGDTMVYCEGYVPRKDASGEWTNTGSCDFRISYENKVFGKITAGDIKTLIEGKVVKNKKGDEMRFDPTSVFFTAISFKPDEDL